MSAIFREKGSQLARQSGLHCQRLGESDVLLQMNSKPVQQGEDFRVGHEDTPTGTDLIIWLKMKSCDPVKFSIAPRSPIPENKP